ncbi:MAG: aminotransferase class V-fold PLP-dependent enzyme [Saprospiraceae bacterium]|nr:aminotransferase class V-fold PLP-dependent enzyme [Saprospiraceae bacterium]MCF8251156.1 aminotransferase class V-fold PLP-dependent enzyme [Saprospiraceae bacterium]MCF8281879.1 aminotransferase class V-fold PLP-dependent enzyme [Bacteroidales bacterium]MCF8312968.1 aminotransferase class V-fold PLP-dependent enzyme [Saprospiraceae bacterium]MCF8441415.1 aminotransferase class V-fold PLP-dependent enzyme [Saprospiraceae bacterium]
MFIDEIATLFGKHALHPSFEAAFGVDRNQPVDFEKDIRPCFSLPDGILNLNSAGIQPTPASTLAALHHYNQLCSQAPSFYTWGLFEQVKKPLRQHLARLAGVDIKELALTRNATEALNNIVFGIPLSENDEVVLSEFDYPNILNAWKQRAQKDRIRLVWADLQLPSENEDELIHAYVSKFSDRTKVVYLTHIINWCGQRLPVEKICQAAKAQGIETIVDGSQSFALLDYRISDLGCDYFGTSLHKWLAAPIGTGLLWMRQEKIPGVLPLLGNKKPDGGDIRKFESTGIRSLALEIALGYSLDFHNWITTARKGERLFYLKNRWMMALSEIDRVQFFTSFSREWSCAIGMFGIKDIPPAALNKLLFEKYGIHAAALQRGNVAGVRVSPTVYASEEEMDRLVEAVREIVTG